MVKILQTKDHQVHDGDSTRPSSQNCEAIFPQINRDARVCSDRPRTTEKPFEARESGVNSEHLESRTISYRYRLKHHEPTTNCATPTLRGKGGCATIKALRKCAISLLLQAHTSWKMLRNHHRCYHRQAGVKHATTTRIVVVPGLGRNLFCDQDPGPNQNHLLQQGTT